MRITRRTLFDGNLLRVGHVVARPSSSTPGDVEHQSLNVLVLPLAGVFVKHEGPRRHVVGTPNHAVFISAGSPYRLSYPAKIGDEALTLWFSGAALARVMPEAVAGDGFDGSAFGSDALLPARTMLGRSLLWRQLERGESDPLEVEELAVGLLASALRAARRKEHNKRGVLRERAGRSVERVKEAVSLHPERKWTLGELADLACMSPCHLAHVFRDKVGASVYRYVVRSRLAKALVAVLDGDAELGAIALEAGFATHSHFTARFRALFGVTPLELRRRGSSKTAAELRKIVTAQEFAAV